VTNDHRPSDLFGHVQWQRVELCLHQPTVPPCWFLPNFSTSPTLEAISLHVGLRHWVRTMTMLMMMHACYTVHTWRHAWDERAVYAGDSCCDAPIDTPPPLIRLCVPVAGMVLIAVSQLIMMRSIVSESVTAQLL